jgi:hypothetical protein
LCGKKCHTNPKAGMNKTIGEQAGWEIQQVNDETPGWN